MTVRKGKGNLRRHIEWHLRRIEDECKHGGVSQPQGTEVSVKSVTASGGHHRKFLFNYEIENAKIPFSDPEVVAKESEALEILRQNFRAPGNFSELLSDVQQ